MFRRAAIPVSITCDALVTSVTILESTQRRFLKQARTPFKLYHQKDPKLHYRKRGSDPQPVLLSNNITGGNQKKTLKAKNCSLPRPNTSSVSTSPHVSAAGADGFNAGMISSRELSVRTDIDFVVSKLGPLFEEFHRKKAQTPLDERRALASTCIDNMKKIIESYPLLNFNGDMEVTLFQSRNDQDFEMLVRNSFIDSRPPLDRIFDATMTNYGCSTFLSRATRCSLGARSQLESWEYAPLVQTPLLKELKTYINEKEKKALLVSGSSGSGKTTSVIGLGSIQDGLNRRTAVLVSLPTDATGWFSGIASGQRKLDRAKAKATGLQDMIDRGDSSPEAIRNLEFNDLILGVDVALNALQEDAAWHFSWLAYDKKKELELSAEFGCKLSDARVQARKTLASAEMSGKRKADVYTEAYNSILGCLQYAPKDLSCKWVEEAISKALKSIKEPISSAAVTLEDLTSQLAMQEKDVAKLVTDLNSMVLAMLACEVEIIAGKKAYLEMGFLEGARMNLVIFLDQMGWHPEVVRALCSFPVDTLEQKINKDRQVSVWLIAGGTGVGCRQHPDGSNVKSYEMFFAEGGEANRDIFKAYFRDGRTFEKFKDSLAIKIDDLFPAIDSNARLAFTLGRFAKVANDIIAVSINDGRRQVTIDFKGLLKMAAITWKSLNALERIPSTEMFKVMVDALTMYLFPDSESAYDGDTERTSGLLVDKANWVYDTATKSSRLSIPDAGRYAISPFMVPLLSMTCDVDQLSQSMTSGDTLEQWQTVVYLLACAAKDDKVLAKLLAAGNKGNGYCVGPITKAELGEVKMLGKRSTTSLFRELPESHEDFLQNVAEGLEGLRNTRSSEVPEKAKRHTSRKPKSDFELATKLLTRRVAPEFGRCYIACFRSPDELPFADVFLFIGSTLLLVHVKGDDGESYDASAYHYERWKIGATDSMAMEAHTTACDPEDPKTPSKRVEHLKCLWHKATGQQITSVRLCFATSDAEECESLRVNCAPQVGEHCTDTDIFLSAAGIRFYKLKPRRR